MHKNAANENILLFCNLTLICQSIIFLSIITSHQIVQISQKIFIQIEQFQMIYPNLMFKEVIWHLIHLDKQLDI